MAAQYDAIGDSYVKTMAIDRLETHSMARVLGRVDGQNCLDLATGHGRCARLLIDQGAAHVVGTDVSEKMIQRAKETHKDEPRLEFRVNDGGQVKEVEGGPFDLVTSIWLLNYAASPEALQAMFENMRVNLKPGGRVVALTNNVWINPADTMDRKYGADVLSMERLDNGGYKGRFRLLADTKNPYELECYNFMRDVYERVVEKAGLVDLEWRSYAIPDVDGLPEEFWDLYKLRPHVCILTARKPT
ncbi:S-adenosyl-L-methionine-dependent methyltransferase [Teratosphaeria destructans]|uniref:S-adenosyl-L-methionine-dependent methyltransferase n=1 Tax=Teratosphaeria destructans TaxID=418781 RepID=A0A9W7T190_9PEZI|nr:S-adenosyl-L-methionine-dependent methyltransferase [Teratosphaeria destructans]